MKQIKHLSFMFLALILSVLMGCSKTDTADTVGTTGSATVRDVVADAVITAKVKAALVKEPTLKATDITVETKGGAVQLRGSAPSRADAERAAEVAKQVDGVKAVKNDLQVKSA